MKKNITTLNKLPMNTNGTIENLMCTGETRRRLLDLGLIKGTTLTPVLISPSKDPRAFEVRGTLIAIRKEDAKLIYIKF